MTPEERKKRLEEIDGHHDRGSHCNPSDERCWLLAEVKRARAERDESRDSYQRLLAQFLRLDAELDAVKMVANAALADVERLRERGNELWDALDRIRQFRHHEACDRRDACACWELELHVLLPILRNESAATEPKPIKETHKESVMSREPKT